MISIITATYNSEATLPDTINSVAAQSHSDWEHLIIDGASTDTTLDIARRHQSLHPGKVSIISEPDRGIYDAMNKGLVVAKGDIIGILNSDDFYSSTDILARVDVALQSPDIDAVYGDVVYVDPADTSRIVRRYSSRGFRRWKMRIGLMPAHPSFYCRREVYTRCGAFDPDLRVAADFEHLLRAIYINRTPCRYLPVNFVTMRAGGASSSGLASHRQIRRDHLLAYRKNGLAWGPLLDPLRYPAKILEILLTKLSTK